MKIPDNILQSVPKVLLHDHLDGGLRPLTIIELARDTGYDKLPTQDPGELTTWFHRGRDAGASLFTWKGSRIPAA